MSYYLYLVKVSTRGEGDNDKTPKNLSTWFMDGSKDVLGKVALMSPLLIKVEEILVASRTRKADRLSSYYHHWERKLFDSVGKLLERPSESGI